MRTDGLISLLCRACIGLTADNTWRVWRLWNNTPFIPQCNTYGGVKTYKGWSSIFVGGMRAEKGCLGYCGMRAEKGCLGYGGAGSQRTPSCSRKWQHQCIPPCAHHSRGLTQCPTRACTAWPRGHRRNGAVLATPSLARKGFAVSAAPAARRH